MVDKNREGVAGIMGSMKKGRKVNEKGVKAGIFCLCIFSAVLLLVVNFPLKANEKLGFLLLDVYLQSQDKLILPGTFGISKVTYL